jgi:hypothetical protein
MSVKKASQQEKATKKGTKGFLSGISGNPTGRPPGSRNKTIMAMENLVEGEAEQITRKCIDMALDGDAVAMRLCMSRIISPIKARPVSFKLTNPQELSASIDQIITAGANGEIIPEEAKIFSELVETKRRVLETVDLVERLKNLEMQLGDSK